MNASMIPSRLPEPPPAAPTAFDLDLLDGDRRVGWIAPDRIAFLGFGNTVEAAYAAHVAHRAVARRIAQREGGRAVPVELERLAIRQEDADAIVLASGQPIARIVPPGEESRAGDGFAFELLLVVPRDEVSVRAKAHLVYRTLRRSGVRWSMFRRPAAPVRATAEAPVAAPRSVEAGKHDGAISRPYAVATALSVLLLVVAVLVPGVVAAAFAGVALTALLVMRLTVLHSRWPRRGMPVHALVRRSPY